MSQSSLGLNREEVLVDFQLARLSREIALLARKEVLSGKAKFGIFGDGKEVAQIALARNFHEWRLAFGILPRPHLHDGNRDHQC